MNKLLSLLVATAITLTGIATSHAYPSHERIARSAITADTPFVAEPITLETPTAVLYGTLERPVTKSRVPIVLILSGSGPSDRDGNSPALPGTNNCLKLLAEALAARGIASVRYDKRSIGETGKAMLAAAEKTKTVLKENDLSFENFIDDAVRWGKQLRADRRFSSVSLAGHSEGSTIAMVAAQRLGAKSYISIAGPGRPLQQVILEQIRPQFTPELFKRTEEILAQLVAGKTVASVPSELNILFRPAIQPYMISWLRYDPSKEIAKLRMPVLIAQGTTDLQVTVVDAKALAAGNPSAKLLLIDSMNHTLKKATNNQEQKAAYSDPKLPVVPELIDGIGNFLLKNARK